MSASPRANRRVAAGGGFLVILAALNGVGPFSNDAYLPGLPQLSDDLSTSASLAGATLTAVMIGLALGQLVMGPVSDSLGRLRPLLAGVATFAVASLLCAVAPNIWVLLVFRLVQGFAGGTGIVICRAIVRDLHEGVAAVRYFGMLMLVQSVAPIIAPVIGAQILYVTSWRGIFVAMSVIGAVLLTAIVVRLPETLPAADRHGDGLGSTLVTFRRLLSQRSFDGYLLAMAFPFASMFAYIAGSSFVLQNIYGLSPQEFALVFAANAVGIGALGHLSARLVARIGPNRLLAAGLVMSAVGGLLMLFCALASSGLVPVLVAFFIAVSAIGLVMPNATAQALAGDPRTAGSASGLLGLSQFVLGAAVAPLVGLAGSSSAVPLGIAMATLGVLACISFALLVALPAHGLRHAARSSNG
ncbi:MAG TPA: multidrug effflux MFS transporter [Gaiellaceae bacterium]|nr:multidrug effflux MFS transporter [Gaiellaceae bacterium]